MEPTAFDRMLAEWMRLEGEAHALRLEPITPENDARFQAIADRQKAIVIALYRTPAGTVGDMLLKLQFVMRSREAHLPEDLREEDAYALPHVEGRGTLPLALAALWADAKRLSEPGA